MKRNWRIALPLIALLAAVAVVVPVFMEGRQGEQQTQQRPSRRRGGGSGDPISVLASTVRLADVPVYIEGVGPARRASPVIVKPQVDGQLRKILFVEGHEVR